MEIQGLSTDNIRNSVLLPFVSETIHTMKTMAGINASSDLLTYHDPLDVFTFKDFAVSINTTFTNGVTNNIVMMFDLNTAIIVGNQIRSVILGTTESSSILTDDINEALAEMLNTIIGLATREINETNHKITFGAPLYLYSKEDSEFLLPGIKQIMTVPIELDKIGRIHLSYLTR